MSAADRPVLGIHYDCDPGQDDAIALLYALGSKALSVKSVSTVAGNVEVEKGTRNALQLLEFTGNGHIPVYQGCTTPLVKPLLTLPQVFGPSGMAGAEHLSQPTLAPQPISATAFLAQSNLPATVVATGPLTNLASALQINPALGSHVQHLILMGGCVYPDPLFHALGNLTVKGKKEGKAEYNFALDPEAAQIVFRAGIQHLSLIGLEVSRPLLFNSRLQQRLQQVGTRSALLAARILSTVGEEDRQEYKAFWQSPDDPVRAMYDVVAMAYADHPELFKKETLPLRIDVEDIPGQTLIDTLRPDHPGVTVITGVNEEAFHTALCENLGRLN